MIVEQVVRSKTAGISGSGCAFGPPAPRLLAWRVAAMTVLLVVARATWAQRDPVARGEGRQMTGLVPFQLDSASMIGSSASDTRVSRIKWIIHE